MKLSTQQREALAKRLEMSAESLRQILNGHKPPSPHLAVRIEQESLGFVSRKDLRKDWQEIWPEIK